MIWILLRTVWWGLAWEHVLRDGHCIVHGFYLFLCVRRGEKQITETTIDSLACLIIPASNGPSSRQEFVRRDCV